MSCKGHSQRVYNATLHLSNSRPDTHTQVDTLAECWAITVEHSSDVTHMQPALTTLVGGISEHL